MAKLTYEQKLEIKQQLLNEISQAEYVDVIGGRSEKKQARASAGYELAHEGLIIKVKRFYGGERYAISETGKQFITDNPQIKTISPAQAQRQSTRDSSGRYAEANECEVCGKRGFEGVYWSDEINGCACEKCIANGLA